MITETDVSLAKASNAALIAFNVKSTKEAKLLAEKDKIKIVKFMKKVKSYHINMKEK